MRATPQSSAVFAIVASCCTPTRLFTGLRQNWSPLQSYTTVTRLPPFVRLRPRGATTLLSQATQLVKGQQGPPDGPTGRVLRPPDPAPSGGPGSCSLRSRCL